MEMMPMIALRRHAARWVLVTVLCLPSATVRADTYAALAFDNATIQPNGPRPFSNGKNYFNMEGSSNNNFASFGVADFNSSVLVNGSGSTVPSPPTGVNGISITLTQANASFTNTGNLNFYLVEDTTTSIQPADAAVLFDPTDPNGEGLNGQLAPVHFLGSGTFTQSDNGTMDVYSFPSDPTVGLDPALVAYVLSVFQIPVVTNPDGSTTGGTFRVVITPADPTVAATYAGFSNTLYQGVAVVGPFLSMDVSFN
jgi:hypothetical protein